MAGTGGERKIRKITAAEITGYLSLLRTEHTPHRFSGKNEPLSPKTLRNVWVTLCSFFAWAATELQIANVMKLEDLKRSAPAREITVSSELHNPTCAKGPGPDFDYSNLNGEKYYNPQVFYRNSKLANMWFAYELQRRLTGTGVTSNAVCPGFVPAAIAARRKSAIDKFFYAQIMARMPFARSLEQASDSYLIAASDPAFEAVGGKFIVDGQEKRSSDDSYAEEKARRLWELSWGMVWPE